MQAFPLLVQWSNDPPAYHGFLPVMERDLEVFIQMPRKGQSRGVGTTKLVAVAPKSPWSTIPRHDPILSGKHGCIFGSEELKDILTGHESHLQQKMDEAMDMESFLVELVDMLEVLICNSKREMDLERPVSFWPQVIEQLDAVGWDKVLQLNKDLSQVQIGLLDASQRNHILTIDFPPGYPAVPLAPRPLEIPKTESGDALNSLEHLAPSVTASQISGGHSTEIVDIVQQAESKLKLFQEFWDVMQDIDERTWVIDPEHPTRMDCMRRCALGNHCSVQMTIDPRNPRILPIIRLFGPTSAVEALRTKLHQNTGLWDSSELVCDNMQILLELDNGFPTPGNASKDELNIECGICYSYRFEGQIPNQLCSHQKCQQPFHRACLYEWLRSVPSTRQSFNTLFGECPYCRETITATVPRT